MCQIDWGLTAAMLGRVGKFLAGIAAIFVLPWQLEFRREVKEYKESLKIMLPISSSVFTLFPWQK